ncbi:MAG: undecaprenyl-diphosphate phosphatase [Verrucomicrobiota bacterium]|nr:undecaprenyl-diphosphate phosphatase [Verrucomicrobiota bacterium]
MHDFLLSLLLGVVEGITEFLPVSSTAHLRITEALLHLDLHDGFWKSYTIIIQLGAILALPVYFRSRIVDLVTTFPRGIRGDRTVLTHPLSLIMIAFVVTAIPAYLLKKQIGQNLESLTVMAWALLIGGIVMWAVDAMFQRPNIDRLDDINLPRAIWIGAVQILSAVFPGTSRSMCTIAAGQTAGLSRATALEFSFFLSMPTMIAATGYDLLKTMRGGHHDAGDGALAPVAISGHQWLIIALGAFVSFIVALIVVAWFMRWVRDRGFTPFAIYRIAVGIVLLIVISRGLL